MTYHLLNIKNATGSIVLWSWTSPWCYSRTSRDVALKPGSHVFFGESGDIARRIHHTPLPCDEDKDLILIHYPTMHLAYAEIRYSFFFRPVEPFTFFWRYGHSQRLVLEDGETGAQSLESHSYVDAAGPDTTVRTAAVPSKVHPANGKPVLQLASVNGVQTPSNWWNAWTTYPLKKGMKWSL